MVYNNLHPSHDKHLREPNLRLGPVRPLERPLLGSHPSPGILALLLALDALEVTHVIRAGLVVSGVERVLASGGDELLLTRGEEAGRVKRGSVV